MIIGLDASTRTVGICILDTNGAIVQNYYLKLDKQKELCTKGDTLRTELQDIKKKYKIQSVYIEDYAQKMSRGTSSAQTITRLAAWNGICQYLSYDIFGVQPELLNVARARKSLSILYSISLKYLVITYSINNSLYLYWLYFYFHRQTTLPNSFQSIVLIK